MEKEVRIGLRVTESFRNKFMEICNEQSINASALLRKWIENYVDDYTHKKEADKEVKIVMQKMQDIDK